MSTTTDVVVDLPSNHRLDIVLEWLGTIAGITGALIMAMHVTWSSWAYPIWLLSSISLTWFGFRRGYYGLMLLQIVFTAVNAVGIATWLLFPVFHIGG